MPQAWMAAPELRKRRPKPETFRRFFAFAGFLPHAGQEAILKLIEEDLNCVVAAGIRFGKSKFAAAIAAASSFIPGQYIWCVGPTYDLADKVFRECWALCLKTGLLDPEKSAYVKGVIVTRTGSVIERKSADNPTSLIGEGVTLVILDEACQVKPSVFQRQLLGRITDRNGRIFMISSPNGQDWVYDLFESVRRGEMPGWGAVRAPTWANTIMFPKGREETVFRERQNYYERLGMPELFDQEYGALFTAVVGRLFRTWLRSKNVVPHAQLPRASEVYIGFDWGWEHYSAWTLVGRSLDRRWIVLDEWRAQRAEPEMIYQGLADLLARNGVDKKQLTHLFYDPSRVDYAAHLRRLGYVNVTPANNSRDEGVMAVASALAEPNPMLVSDRCPGLATELDNLHHPDGVGKQGTALDYVRLNDDSYDTLRYVIASVMKRENARWHLHPGRP